MLLVKILGNVSMSQFKKNGDGQVYLLNLIFFSLPFMKYTHVLFTVLLL